MKSKLILIAFLILSLIMTGCNMPLTRPTETSAPTVPPESSSVSPQSEPTQFEPTQTAVITPELPTPSLPPEIVHKDIPGAPIGKVLQTVHDQVNTATAPNKQAFGGDSFRTGKYERPFDQSMNYLPLADLVSVQLSREDPQWIYILFKVTKPFTDDPEADTHFMVELDTDLDNRGNYLIVTGMPKSTEWSTGSVLVLTNPDLNVGGVSVVKPDEKLSEGRGYYSEVFNNGMGEDADLAWSRLSKVDSAVAQIAFKNTLTGGGKGKFIWLPWSDAGILDWSLFEFNDHFTLSTAGYPVKDDMTNYPLKALWGIDNTCRVPSGFTPTGTMPGLCENYDPVPYKEDKPVPCSCDPRDKKCVCP
jgi:hypothetical protein